MNGSKVRVFLAQRVKSITALIVTSGGVIAAALGLPSWVALVAVALIAGPAVHMSPANMPAPAALAAPTGNPAADMPAPPAEGTTT